MNLFLSLLWTAVWWFVAWSHFPWLSEYSFFPLWVGYILSVNAISQTIFKASLIKRMGVSFLWLFAASVPQWWFFEYLNSIVQNWHYAYRPVSSLQYVVQSSIDFSTVVPAVLSTAFLFQYLFKKLGERSYLLVPVTRAWCVPLMISGVISLGLMYVFPNEAFPLVWIAPLLILDPINYLLGLPSVLRYIERGKWLVPLSVMLGTLFAGFWWEMWNFWSYPKWFYTIPYVGFLKVFEMPILGYGGYLFFGLIIWSYTALVFWVFFKERVRIWLEVAAQE